MQFYQLRLVNFVIMKNKSFAVLGVMSGTSLDGIDIALLHFEKNDGWDYRILEAETFAYTPFWKKRLQEAFYLDPVALNDLNKVYTEYLAGVINTFIAKHGLADLDAICSHGHTIWHRPEEGVTVQIGNRRELAALTGFTVVCDFRVQDVELGGQGAPLVPVGDRMLFSSYRYCLNLGGFANISVEGEKGRLAYDICAVNTVLNHYAMKLGYDYDAGGEIARSGIPDEHLKEQLSQLTFYKETPPKSLGVEWVGSEVLPLIEASGLGARDILATYTLHVAEQLAAATRSPGSLLVTGGGALNTFLLELLQERTSSTVIVPDRKLIDNKEALIFGFLGVLRLLGEVNCLGSVTGASRDHCSGKVFTP